MRLRETRDLIWDVIITVTLFLAAGWLLMLLAIRGGSARLDDNSRSAHLIGILSVLVNCLIGYLLWLLVS